ncbi:MAG: hypothetical protein ACRD4R_03735 [Candidatus Acidiferrales bacterium]
MRSTAFAGARVCLIGFLAASLLNLPLMAAPSPSLGMIVTSSNALLGNADATRGADVYPGDTLMTQPDGTLRLAFGSSQLYLLESTQATMLRNSGAVRAKVNTGTVDFSMQPGQLEVQTPLGVIRDAGNERASGQVAVLSPTEIQISAYDGELLVAGVDGEAKSIAAGETYDATVSPAGGPTDPGILGVGRPRKINWRRIRAAAVILGATGVISYVLYHEFTESCSQINCGH